MKEFDKELKKYDYDFPEELIAQEPAAPRDSAKLLIFDRRTGRTEWDTFRNLVKYLPKGAVIVLNETKVVPARLILHKISGGRVRALFIGRGRKGFKFLCDRSLRRGEVLSAAPGIEFQADEEDGAYILKPMFPAGKFRAVLEKYGEAPIPPYIKRSPLSASELKSEYQTVFAKKKGSVAAPTASLHFTRELMKDLRRAGVDLVKVTLHVNLGTFAPLKEEQFKKGELHSEYYEVSAATAKFLNEAKKKKRPIIAVGTTVVRTLESSAKSGRVKPGRGETKLFIKEGFRLEIVDGLITNFHVPRSSLLMLVSAFVSRTKLLRLYRAAIKKGFRLFSFGDGMLIR